MTTPANRRGAAVTAGGTRAASISAHTRPRKSGHGEEKLRHKGKAPGLGFGVFSFLLYAFWYSQNVLEWACVSL